MSLIAKIIEKLKKYPQLIVDEDKYGISVTPDGGFTVWATENENSYTVGFEGWHEEFDNIDEALNCFAYGLSNKCRLKIIERGNVAHRWVAQSLENGQWVNGSTTGLILFPFWRKARVSYRQNEIINS